MRFISIASTAAVLGLAGCAGHTTTVTRPATLRAERLGPLTPCTLPTIAEPLLCGELRVPENPALPSGRTIGLFAVVLPALTDTPVAGALVELTGGPGQAATDYARAYTQELREYRRDRDVLLVDQRGMGRSNPLYCESLALHRLSALFERWPADSVEACRKTLALTADLSQYSTAHAAEDLEAVRAWLGYERLDLFSYSYGTRVAVTYMRRFPQRVRSAVLWGVVPPDFRRPLFYPRDGQRAMDRLLDECLADDQCARTFPNVRTELSDVVRRLDRDSLAVTILDPVTETPLPVRITRAGFAEALWIALSYPDRARELPRIIHHAARGDFTPFLALDVATAPPRRTYYNGAHLSVVCPEETLQVHRDELEGIPDDWFMPKDRLRQYLRACAIWDIPVYPATVEDGEPVHVPTLIVSGEMDPITPPVWGAAIARTLPRSRHLIVRHLSHESDGLSDAGCLDRIFMAFLRAGDPNSLDARCTESMRPPRFALDAERE